MFALFSFNFIGEKAVIYKQIVQGQQQVVIGATSKTFAFNHVFGQDEGQQQIYDKTAAKMVDKLFKGYNATILAYGQTGSGKTYTMGTGCIANEDRRNVGIVPRAVGKFNPPRPLLTPSYKELTSEPLELTSDI